MILRKAAKIMTRNSHQIDFKGWKLLTISIRTGSPEVFVIEPDTGNSVNLTRNPDSYQRYPSWSPNGREVAFTSDRDGTFNVYLISADGKNLRQLTHYQKPVGAGMQSWTSDGAFIYFSIFGDGVPKMCRLNLGDAACSVIGEGIDPAISPDGKQIAFARHLANGHCLFVSDSECKDVQQIGLRENPFAGIHPVWTPDGKHIIYADAAGEALELFSCDENGKDARQLTSFGQAATSPDVSPDGRFVTFRLCDEIYWRDPAASERAYREKRADKRPVWVMESDGSNPRVIECMRYQATIDGSRACFQPQPIKP
jgi:TolB protein